MTHRLNSFDLFDTLLTRNVARPKDIFALLALARRTGIDAQAREAAEHRLAREAGHDPQLVDIYRSLCDDDATARQWAAAEIALELDMLRPRGSVVERLEKLREAGAAVAIVSDTPHDEATLRAFIERHLPFVPDIVLASADHRRSKARGDLFETLTERSRVAAQDILHIGDNPRGDVASARTAGLIAEQIASPLENYLAHRQHARVFAEFSHRLTPAESVALGVMKNRWFDTPRTTAFGGELECFGYIAYGPFILALAVWLIGIARKRGVETIHCLSRDGHVVAKAIDAVAAHFDLPQRARYTLASRRLSKLLEVETVTDLRRLLIAARGSTSQRLASVLPQPALPEGAGNNDVDTLLAAHGDALLAAVRAQQERYRSYLVNAGLDSGGLIFDIGYKGTTQRAIARTLGVPVLGAYVQTFPELAEHLPDHRHSTFTYLDPAASRRANQTFQRYRQLHEVVFSAPHGTFCGLEDNARPVFEENAPTTALDRIHAGVEQFVGDFLDAWPLGIEHLDLSPNFALAHAHQHFAAPQDAEDVVMFEALRFSDRFATTAERAFITPRQGDTLPLWREGESRIGNRTPATKLLDGLRSACGTIVFHTTRTLLRSPAKRRKLERDPLIFFSESRRPLARLLRHFY